MMIGLRDSGDVGLHQGLGVRPRKMTTYCGGQGVRRLLQESMALMRKLLLVLVLVLVLVEC